MLPLPVALRIAGTTRSKFSNSKASGHFNIPIAEGRQGVTTMISDEAALDIAFVTVLARRGFAPRDAKSLAALWLDRIRDGRGLSAYQVFGGGTLNDIPASELRTAIEHIGEQAYTPAGSLPRRSTDIVIINVEEIQARVAAWSAHFSEA